MSTTRMRLGSLVTAGVLTFGLAACGGEDDPETTPASTVEDTAVEDETAADEQTEDETATDEQTGTEETATEEETGDAGDAGDATEGEQIPIEEFLALLQAPGEDMLSSYTITMNMEMEGQQSAIDGAVDLSGDSPRMRITMGTPDMGEVELIYAGGEAYMAIPGLTPEGMYLLAPADLLGDTADLEEIDVSTQWDTWEQGAQEVIFLGEEDVDGEQMRRYQVTVDTAAAAEAAGEDAAAATSLGLEETIVYDVWIDDESLMRMMTFGNMGMEDMSMRMDNWGEEQDIQVPDPEQVMDMDELGAGTG